MSRKLEPELDPQQLDEIHADIQRDISNGNGATHFQDVLDDLHSTQGSARVDQTPDERAELQRFCLQFHRALDAQVKPQGFRCHGVNLDGTGTGFVIKFRDRDGRPFTVEYGYDDGLHAAAIYGDNMGRAMMREVIEKLMAARDRYFARMAT